MTNNFFSVKPGTTIKILSEDGTWYKGQTIGADVPAKRLSDDVEYEYPTTARRAFVNLAEAVRTSVDDPKNVRTMLNALAGLHVTEVIRTQLLIEYVNSMADDRLVIAGRLANILDGQEKFDAARFVHHATSDSTADDDGEGGKWSYNRLNPEDAQKTTIEAVGDDGETTESVTVL